MEKITKVKILETHSNKRGGYFQFRYEGMKSFDWRTIDYEPYECEIPHIRRGTLVKLVEDERGCIVGIGV